MPHLRKAQVSGQQIHSLTILEIAVMTCSFPMWRKEISVVVGLMPCENFEEPTAVKNLTIYLHVLPASQLNMQFSVCPLLNVSFKIFPLFRILSSYIGVLR
jgi:hypothetical protein